MAELCVKIGRRSESPSTVPHQSHPIGGRNSEFCMPVSFESLVHPTGRTDGARPVIVFLGRPHRHVTQDIHDRCCALLRKRGQVRRGDVAERVGVDWPAKGSLSPLTNGLIDRSRRRRASRSRDPEGASKALTPARPRQARACRRRFERPTRGSIKARHSSACAL